MVQHCPFCGNGIPFTGRTRTPKRSLPRRSSGRRSSGRRGRSGRKRRRRQSARGDVASASATAVADPQWGERVAEIHFAIQLVLVDVFSSPPPAQRRVIRANRPRTQEHSYWHQSKRIAVIEWVAARKRIQARSARDRDRIWREEPAPRRLILAGAHRVRRRSRVEHLALELEEVAEGGLGECAPRGVPDRELAEGGIGVRLDEAGAAGDRQRRLVRALVVEPLRARAELVDRDDVRVDIVAGDVEGEAGGGSVADQLAAVPDVDMVAAVRAVFDAAPVERVVVEAGAGRARWPPSERLP